MKNTRALISSVLLAGSLVLGGSFVPAAAGILRDDFACLKCCRIRSPVSYADTLRWDRPAGKDESSADVFDLRSPCDYDPVNCCPYFCDHIPLPPHCSHFRPDDLP